ncbi:uncharacterized protein LOC142585045 isoform X3 [Dermacentor variabilis]|uniref:uncharacterized protein LOC142585045 isoform X3 n=1 Tax=Dermacentor variabilis TaxID=34621 RepID=UPI003F5C590F
MPSGCLSSMYAPSSSGLLATSIIPASDMCSDAPPLTKVCVTVGATWLLCRRIGQPVTAKEAHVTAAGFLASPPDGCGLCSSTAAAAVRGTERKNQKARLCASMAARVHVTECLMAA